MAIKLTPMAKEHSRHVKSGMICAVAETYGVPFVSKFMYFLWYHTMNSIIIPSILYNYIMHSIIYNPFYNIESIL